MIPHVYIIHISKNNSCTKSKFRFIESYRVMGLSNKWVWWLCLLISIVCHMIVVQGGMFTAGGSGSDCVGGCGVNSGGPGRGSGSDGGFGTSGGGR